MTQYSDKIIENILNDSFDNQKLIDQAAQRDDENSLVRLIEFLLSKGFIDDAESLLKISLNRFPANDEFKLSLAEIDIENGNDNHALDLISQISSESELYTSAQIDKADLYQSEGLLESAEGVLLDLQEHSSDPVVRFALAEFYDSEGENGKSAQLYDYLIEKGFSKIGDIDLHHRLASALASNGKFEDAVDEFKKIGEKNLSAKELSMFAHAYIKSNDEELAIPILEKNIENDEGVSEDYLSLAELYFKKGRNDQQIKVLELAMQADPFNSEIRYRLALAYSQNKRFDDSDEQLRELLKKDPNNPDLISLSALNDLSQKKYQSAFDLLNIHLEDDESDNRYFWYLARADFGLGKVDAAIKNISQVKDYFFDDPQFLKDAFFIVRSKDEDRAKDYLNQYLKLVPDDFEMENYLS